MYEVHKIVGGRLTWKWEKVKKTKEKITNSYI